MTQQNPSRGQSANDEQGFPVQLKLLLGVIGLGVLGIIFKAIGIL